MRLPVHTLLPPLTFVQAEVLSFGAKRDRESNRSLAEDVHGDRGKEAPEVDDI